MKTRKERKLKKGISLIVLVITIIVMIILAAAIIISLSNNGIIGKANEAVEKTDEKQMQILASTLWADAYMNDKRDTELVTAVENGLKEADPEYKSKYEVDITNNGVNLYKVEWETIYEGDGELTDGVLVVSETEHVFSMANHYRLVLEASNGNQIENVSECLIYIEGAHLLGILTEGKFLKYQSFTDAEQKINELIEQGKNYLEIAGQNISEGEAKSSIIALDSDQYKIVKLEKKRNIKVNEYGFQYNKWYKGIVDNTETYYYFSEDNILYQGVIALKWKVEENSVINCYHTNESEPFSFSMVSPEMIYVKIEAFENFEYIIQTTEEKPKIVKNEYGIYTDAIYVIKDKTKLGTDIEFAGKAFASDGFVLSPVMKIDGSLEGTIISSETVDEGNYTVSSDGKTVTDKTGDVDIEYVLLEEIYDLG